MAASNHWDADIESAMRGSATTFSSMTQQLSVLLAVALAVLVIRLSVLATTGTTDAAAIFPNFQAALALMGGVGVLLSQRLPVLPRDAGAEVSGRGPASHLTPLLLYNIQSYMKRDSRLSGVLHVLLHMAETDGPVTSEHLSKAMQTNPVVIRRIMAGLRDQGLVRSAKGHNGGWTLARDLATVSLREIYEALGSPGVFAMGNRTEAPGCLVEEAVNAALDDTFARAEALLLERFGEVTLAMLHADFHARLKRRPSHCEFKDEPDAA